MQKTSITYKQCSTITKCSPIPVAQLHTQTDPATAAASSPGIQTLEGITFWNAVGITSSLF